jgi:putative endonuclease
MSKANFYYTYVLKSLKDNKLYTGWTNDIENRLTMHLNGKVPATEHRLPLILIYYEACLTQESAIAREKQLKTGFGRAYLKRRLNL